MNSIQTIAGEAREFLSGYFATSEGRIFSTRQKHLGITERKMQLTNKGYLISDFQVDGRARKCTVHRAVLLAWIGPPPSPSHEGRHLDGNRLNNSNLNLAWGTAWENTQDKKRHGSRWARGTAQGASKLTEEQVCEIRKPGPSTRSLARRFNVHQKTIQDIRRGKNWGWLLAPDAVRKENGA
jgi:hypothetical protein